MTFQVFTELEHRCPPALRRYIELYSLIPLFPESDQRPKPYELYCNIPPTSVVNDKGNFETISSPENTVQQRLYRIFSYKDAWRRKTPGIVRFTPAPPYHEATTDYWHIPVKCHIILYFLIRGTVTRKSSSPEVALASKIYAKLLMLRGTPSQTNLPILAVETAVDSASLSLEEASFAANPELFMQGVRVIGWFSCRPK
jgi:hypothetical protein